MLFYDAYYNYDKDQIIIHSHIKGYERVHLFIHEYIHRFFYKCFYEKHHKIWYVCNFIWDMLDNPLKQLPLYFAHWKYQFPELVYGGGKKGGSETTVDYHWVFAIAEVLCYEKTLIAFEARLGNMLTIGDGVITTAKIPSYWMKKYFYTKGYGYIKCFPYTIRLYKNTIENELIEDTDFTYDNATGEIVYLFTPMVGDYIAGTWTYDEEYKEETTFYASFDFNNIYKRVGIKYFKYQDEGLNSYLKCALKAHHLLSELYKPIVYGTYDIVFNPDVKIGHSIYIHHQLPNVNRIFFIDKIRESHSKTNHTVEVSGISFPELYAMARYKNEQSWKRLELTIPTNIVTFIGTDAHTDGFYLIGKVKKLGSSTLDKRYHDQMRFKIKKTDEWKLFPAVVPFVPNTRDIGVFQGRIYQWYDISFTNAEGTYPEFTDEDVFFAKRLVNFELYSATNTYDTTNKAQTVFIGRKELLNKGTNIAHYASGDHIIFVDVEGDVWLCDYRFATKKISSLETGDIGASKINLMGAYTHAFCLFDTTMKQIDIDTGLWTSLGDLSHDYPLQTSNRRFYIDVNDFMHFFSQANITGSVGNYNNYLDVVKYKNGVMTEVNFLNETGVAEYVGGKPFIMDKYVFWGKRVWELLDGTGGVIHLINLPLGGTPSVYYADTFNKGSLVATVCYDQTNSLTDSYGKGTKWSFHLRPSNFGTPSNWSILGSVEFDSDMTIIPLCVTEGLVVYLKGEALQSILHPDTDCAIGIIPFTGNKIKLKLAKVNGEGDDIFNHGFFLGSSFYLNWKELSGISLLETIGEISL